MKFWAIIRFLNELKNFTLAGLSPTLKDVFITPSILLRPKALSRLLLSHIWELYGPGMDAGMRTIKENLITPNARGFVLDVGAGHGHVVKYLHRDKVTQYIAVEPNTHMHWHIREHADAAGFHESDGSLIILSCSAEDVQPTLTALAPPGSSTRGGVYQIDTIICVHSLCSIPSAEATITKIVRDMLVSGGELLFSEHVRSPSEDVAWWQAFWSPIWQIPADGCRLDKATDKWIERMPSGSVEAGGQESGEETQMLGSMWKEGRAWSEDENWEDALFWHRTGRFVKR